MEQRNKSEHHLQPIAYPYTYKQHLLKKDGVFA